MLRIIPTPLAALRISGKWLLFCCLLITFIPSSFSQADMKKMNVLVYTRNGKGYIHKNVPYASKAIEELGKKHGFSVTVADTPLVFTDANLAKYNMLVFTSTNNDVFDNDDQRLVFRRYIESGGGFVGVHSVTGTERNWTWFKNMLGCTFSWHANNQEYVVRNIRPSHPSMKDVPLVWKKKDECYFGKELYPGIEVLMAHDITTLNPNQSETIAKNAGMYNVLYPAVWYHNYDGGHIWVTALGHDPENYSDPVFINHIYQGMRYIAGKAVRKDLKKAYATHRDQPVQFQ